jgi:hypothetical protein
MNKFKYYFGFLLITIFISLFLMQANLEINLPYIFSDFSKSNIQPKIDYKITNVYNHSIFDNLTIEKVEFNITKDLIAFLHIPKTGGTDFEIKLVSNLTRFNQRLKNVTNACEFKPNEVIDQKLKLNQYYSKYYCGRHLKYNVRRPDSMQNSWLFSRYTYGWGLRWSCKRLFCIFFVFGKKSPFLGNVHSDYAKLKNCMPNVRKINSFLRNIHIITILRDPKLRYISEYIHTVCFNFII